MGFGRYQPIHASVSSHGFQGTAMEGQFLPTGELRDHFKHGSGAGLRQELSTASLRYILEGSPVTQPSHLTRCLPARSRPDHQGVDGCHGRATRQEIRECLQIEDSQRTSAPTLNFRTSGAGKLPRCGDSFSCCEGPVQQIGIVPHISKNKAAVPPT